MYFNEHNGISTMTMRKFILPKLFNLRRSIRLAVAKLPIKSKFIPTGFFWLQCILKVTMVLRLLSCKFLGWGYRIWFPEHHSNCFGGNILPWQGFSACSFNDSHNELRLEGAGMPA